MKIRKKTKKARNNAALIKNRIVPALLTALTVSILTYVLYSVNFDLNYGRGSSAILFASFGVSAFILFMMPRAKSSKVSKFVKAYAIGALVGLLGFYMLDILPLYLVAGIVIFMVSMLLYITNSEHPPGIGIALAFVLYRIDLYGVLVVVIGVAILLFLRMILEKFVYIVEKDLAREL